MSPADYLSALPVDLQHEVLSTLSLECLFTLSRVNRYFAWICTAELHTRLIHLPERLWEHAITSNITYGSLINVKDILHRRPGQAWELQDLMVQGLWTAYLNRSYTRYINPVCYWAIVAFLGAVVGVEVREAVPLLGLVGYKNIDGGTKKLVLRLASNSGMERPKMALKAAWGLRERFWLGRLPAAFQSEGENWSDGNADDFESEGEDWVERGVQSENGNELVYEEGRVPCPNCGTLCKNPQGVQIHLRGCFRDGYGGYAPWVELARQG